MLLNVIKYKCLIFFPSLFGSEDVDLRQLTQQPPPLIKQLAPTPPPPPNISIDNDKDDDTGNWSKIKVIHLLIHKIILLLFYYR